MPKGTSQKPNKKDGSGLKTLISAKHDFFAENIVHICREVFGAGNGFCKKITYQATQWPRRPAADSGENSGETPLPRRQKGRDLIKVQRPLRPTTIRRRRTRRGGEADTFCNSTMPRIAVTVDMIATGTDIKPLEALIFLRDVRSRVYFEQMKGRGTRVATPTDLQSVSGEDARAIRKDKCLDELELQRAIRRLSVVEELESVVAANLQRATRLRQSILQKAFTGELC